MKEVMIYIALVAFVLCIGSRGHMIKLRGGLVYFLISISVCLGGGYMYVRWGYGGIV